jgi:hypothetical protein
MRRLSTKQQHWAGPLTWQSRPLCRQPVNERAVVEGSWYRGGKQLVLGAALMGRCRVLDSPGHISSSIDLDVRTLYWLVCVAGYVNDWLCHCLRFLGVCVVSHPCPGTEGYRSLVSRVSAQ